MKSIMLLAALCTFYSPAIVQANECRSILKATDRLACYDKAEPPTSSDKSAAASKMPSSRPDQATDPLAAENARLDAKINNICRGC
jgi:hypothetical protein